MLQRAAWDRRAPSYILAAYGHGYKCVATQINYNGNSHAKCAWLTANDWKARHAKRVAARCNTIFLAAVSLSELAASPLLPLVPAVVCSSFSQLYRAMLTSMAE